MLAVQKAALTVVEMVVEMVACWVESMVAVMAEMKGKRSVVSRVGSKVVARADSMVGLLGVCWVAMKVAW